MRSLIRTMMSEQLPCYLYGDEHPYLIKMVAAYKPHTSIPSRQEMLMNQYEQQSYCNIRALADDIDIDYDVRVRAND